MCGLPFSGKTVLATELSKRFGFQVVGIDTIREEKGFSWEDNDRVTSDDWKNIFEESYARTLRYLAAGQGVLYDSANQDRASRDRLRKLAKSGNFESKVILVDVAVNELRARWLKNQATKERFHLPEKFLQAAIDTFEKPTSDENVLTYRQLMDVETWIADKFSLSQ